MRGDAADERQTLSHRKYIKASLNTGLIKIKRKKPRGKINCKKKSQNDTKRNKSALQAYFFSPHFPFLSSVLAEVTCAAVINNSLLGTTLTNAFIFAAEK